MYKVLSQLADWLASAVGALGNSSATIFIYEEYERFHELHILNILQTEQRMV